MSDTNPPATSTSIGPKSCETANCTAAKLPPATSTAGHTSRSPRQPDIATTIQAGIKSEKNGNCRPAMMLITSGEIPVTLPSVMIGMPSEPKATGAVFANSASPAAYSGGKPTPIIKADEMATGAPKPAQPSKNAPKLKAMSKA